MAATNGTYDVSVAGVGAMGAAACWHLARRGLRVLGLERFSIPNTMGSSHGHNRIIRSAYFEHPSYVPMVRRAFELWREAEQAAGETLLYVTGGIDSGPPDGRIVSGSLASCREHDLPHELLDRRALAARFPGWRLPEDFVAVVQPDAGFIACERAVEAHAALARAAGADLRTFEAIIGWAVTAAGKVEVTTATGRYEAAQLVLSTGAWIADHVPALAGKAVAERQTLGWFKPRDADVFQPDRFPVGTVDTAPSFLYVYPEWGIPGFKIGLYNHLQESGHADDLSRDPTDRDEAVLRQAVEKFFPDAAGACLSLQCCLFTNIPDGHFVIDRLADTPQVVVVSPCSGHGFKFSPVVGEAVADLITDRPARLDLSLFGLARLMAGP